jgi:ATP-dependent RNA helicase DeaD
MIIAHEIKPSFKQSEYFDGLDKGTLLGLICNRAGINKNSIGKIDLKGVYSFFEVEPTATHSVLNNLNGFDFKGRIIRIETQSTEPKPRRESSSEPRREFSSRDSSAGRSDSRPPRRDAGRSSSSSRGGEHRKGRR